MNECNSKPNSWNYWALEMGALILAFLAVFALFFERHLLGHSVSVTSKTNINPDTYYGRLPLSFEPNLGQTDPQVKFLCRGRGYTLFLTGKGAVLALSHPGEGSLKGTRFANRKEFDPRRRVPGSLSILKLRLIGAGRHVTFKGEDKLPGISNYFIGNNPSKWRTDIPTYGRLMVRDVYPGVDMVYYGRQGRLEYDFVVAPGADPKVIKLALSGMKGARLDSKGNLCMTADRGEVALRAPVVYQLRDGRREGVGGRYVMAGKGEVGFKVESYDPSEPLVIDPVLDYSTYLGGSNVANANSIAVDSNGNAYVTGYEESTNFPITSGAYQSNQDSYDFHVFVTKLNPSGTALVYSTFLEGNSLDYSCAIAVDSAGNAYVGGNTESTNFPTSAGAFESTQDGVGVPAGMTSDTPENAFVTKLNGAGDAIDYSTYLGGIAFDVVLGIAVDSSGDAYVTGETEDNFPTTAGAYLTNVLAYNNFAFVTKLNPTGTALIYSTLLGGNNPNGGVGWEIGSGIAVDSGGNAYVIGTSSAPYFPTTPGAFQSTLKGVVNAFVTKINPSGTALVYSTYLGGSSDDEPIGVALDFSGNAFITGYAKSSDFPTTSGAFQTKLNGSQSAFVTKLNSSGTALVYSTFLGGDNDDGGLAIAVDSDGNAYINGNTKSTNFPIMPGAFQTSLVGAESVFLTKLNGMGSELLYSTYLGESSNGFYGGSNGAGIALDGNGGVYLTGPTDSTVFPTTAGAYQTALAGTSNAFVTKFDKAAFNTPTPTFTDTPTVTFTPTMTPTPTTTFTPTLTGTPTNTPTVTPTSTPTPMPGYTGSDAPGLGESFVYPSPATGETINIAYYMKEGGTAQVLIWNESAELVADVSQEQWVGPQKTTVTIRGWARGVYFYRVVLRYNSGETEKLPPGKFFIGWR